MIVTWAAPAPGSRDDFRGEGVVCVFFDGVYLSRRNLFWLIQGVDEFRGFIDL